MKRRMLDQERERGRKREERRKNSSLKSECSPKAPRRLAAVGGREGEVREGSGRFIHKTPTVSTRCPTLSPTSEPRRVPFYPFLTGAMPAAGPTPRDCRRPPVLAYHSSPRRGPPTDNESRNSPGLPARRFLSVSPLRSVDQTKESEKRPTTSEFQGPLAPFPLPLSSQSVCPLRPSSSQLPSSEDASLVYSVYGYLRAARSLSLCLSLSPSLNVENIDVAPSGSRIVQRNPRHPPR